jgi:hypothetical protein
MIELEKQNLKKIKNINLEDNSPESGLHHEYL